MLHGARDLNVQTEEISILKQLVVWNWNCVKMNMILLFYHEAYRFTEEICLIVKSFISRS